MEILEIRKWINLVLEIENNEIRYFGKLSNDDQRWLEKKGRNTYSGGTLQPIIINGIMVGGIHWDLGGIDYIEFKPEFKGKGTLRKVVLDNIENGEVKFVSASDELKSKLANYGTVNFEPGTDITTVKFN